MTNVGGDRVKSVRNGTSWAAGRGAQGVSVACIRIIMLCTYV